MSVDDVMDVRKLPGLKAKDLKRCASCLKGVADGGMTFYRLVVERYILDPNACRRAIGLEMQLGPLAGVMGPDEDLAKRLDEPKTFIICQECALMKPITIVMLDEEER